MDSCVQGLALHLTDGIRRGAMACLQPCQPPQKAGRTAGSVSNNKEGFQVDRGGLTCTGRSNWCLQQAPPACSCGQGGVGAGILCHHRGRPLCQTGCSRRRRLRVRGCLWSTWLSLGGSRGCCWGTAALLQGGQTGPAGGTVHRHLHGQQTPPGEPTRLRSSRLRSCDAGSHTNDVLPAHWISFDKLEALLGQDIV